MIRSVVLGCLFFVFPASLLAVNIDGEVRVGIRPGLDKPAIVQLLHEQDIVNEQLTDLEGHFEFRGVAPDDYTIRAVYGDFPAQLVRLDVVNADTEYKIPITIQPPKEQSLAVLPSGTATVVQLSIPKAAVQEYEKGLSAREDGNCGKAMPHLQKALDLYPNYGDAFNEMGTCLKASGENSKAEASFLKAVQYTPTVYPSINLADLYASMHRLGDAETVVRASLAKDPNEGDLYFALARIQLEQGKTAEAEVSGLRAHSLPHRAADVHLLLAKIYLAEKNNSAVATQLKFYVEEHPKGAIADQIRKQLSLP